MSAPVLCRGAFRRDRCRKTANRVCDACRRDFCGTHARVSDLLPFTVNDKWTPNLCADCRPRAESRARTYAANAHRALAVIVRRWDAEREYRDAVALAEALDDPDRRDAVLLAAIGPKPNWDVLKAAGLR